MITTAMTAINAKTIGTHPSVVWRTISTMPPMQAIIIETVANAAHPVSVGRGYLVLDGIRTWTLLGLPPRIVAVYHRLSTTKHQIAQLAALLRPMPELPELEAVQDVLNRRILG